MGSLSFVWEIDVPIVPRGAGQSAAMIGSRDSADAVAEPAEIR